MLKELEIDIEFHTGRKNEIVISKNAIEVLFYENKKGIYTKNGFIQFHSNNKISFYNIPNSSFEELMIIKVIIDKIKNQLFNAYF